MEKPPQGAGKMKLHGVSGPIGWNDSEEEEKAKRRITTHLHDRLFGCTTCQRFARRS